MALLDRPMSLGPATEWMMRNPGRCLIDSDGEFWKYDGEQHFMLLGHPVQLSRWQIANLHLPLMIEHRFRIQNEQLEPIDDIKSNPVQPENLGLHQAVREWFEQACDRIAKVKAEVRALESIVARYDVSQPPRHPNTSRLEREIDNYSPFPHQNILVRDTRCCHPGCIGIATGSWLVPRDKSPNNTGPHHFPHCDDHRDSVHTILTKIYQRCQERQEFVVDKAKPYCDPATIDPNDRIVFPPTPFGPESPDDIGYDPSQIGK